MNFPMRHPFFVLVFALLAGCSSATTSPGGGPTDVDEDARSADSEGDDVPASETGGGGTDAAPAVASADCRAIAENAVAAQTKCAGVAPSGGASAVQSACERGVAASALCGGAPARGFECMRSPDASDFVCSLGTIIPSCNADVDAAIGFACVLSLGNPACASIACEYSTDCPTNSLCNGVTNKCFSKSANCVGLPCEYSTDCPTGETCNGAVRACVRG